MNDKNHPLSFAEALEKWINGHDIEAYSGEMYVKPSDDCALLADLKGYPPSKMEIAGNWRVADRIYPLSFDSAVQAWIDGATVECCSGIMFPKKLNSLSAFTNTNGLAPTLGDMQGKWKTY